MYGMLQRDQHLEMSRYANECSFCFFIVIFLLLLMGISSVFIFDCQDKYSTFLINVILSIQIKQVVEEAKDAPRDILTIEDTKDVEAKEDRPPSPPPAEPVKEEKGVAKPPDLLVKTIY